jgi:hypothetical protein
MLIRALLIGDACLIFVQHVYIIYFETRFLFLLFVNATPLLSGIIFLVQSTRDFVSYPSGVMFNFCCSSVLLLAAVSRLGIQFAKKILSQLKWVKFGQLWSNFRLIPRNIQILHL